MVVPVNLRSGFQPKAPIALFETNFRFIEPALDSGFLAAGRPASSSNADLWIVQNWVEEIKQKTNQ